MFKLCMALLFVASVASSEELPAPYEILIESGILCDTHAQVQVQITDLSINDEFVRQEGCALAIRSFPAIITPLEWYETPNLFALIARYNSLVPGNPFIQYGIIAVRYRNDGTETDA